MQVARAPSSARRARATPVGALSRRSDQAREKVWSAIRMHRPSLSFRAMQGASGTQTNYAIVKVCFRYVIYEAGNSLVCKVREHAHLAREVRVPPTPTGDAAPRLPSRPCSSIECHDTPGAIRPIEDVELGQRRTLQHSSALGFRLSISILSCNVACACH